MLRGLLSLARQVWLVPVIVAGCALRAPESAAPEEVVLHFAGDVLLDRNSGRTIEAEGGSEAARDISSFTRNADIAFCNLECPIVAVPRKVSKQFAFAASPEKVVFLKEANFRIVSLANNHAMDCSRAGLVETMERLRTAGVVFCGAGMTRGRAHAPVIVLCRGMRIGFLAFSDLLPQSVVGFPELPNIAYVDDPTIEQEVAAAREGVDVLVVSFHWGEERSHQPTGRQQDLAARVMSAGADIVVGHHPHVLQPLVAMRKSDGRVGVIAYSLGNFVFDSRLPACRQTMVLECRVTRSGVSGVKTCPMGIRGGMPRRDGGAVHTHSLKRVGCSPRVLFSPSGL